MKSENQQNYMAVMMTIGAIISLFTAIISPGNIILWLVALVWIGLAVLHVRRALKSNTKQDE
jgi:hypothetical protein